MSFIKRLFADKIKYLYLKITKQTANINTAIKLNRSSNIVEINEYLKGALNVCLKKYLI